MQADRKAPGAELRGEGWIFYDLRMREGHARLVDKRGSDGSEHGTLRHRQERHLRRGRLPDNEVSVLYFSGRYFAAQRASDGARGSIGTARISVASAVLYRDQ